MPLAGRGPSHAHPLEGAPGHQARPQGVAPRRARLHPEPAVPGRAPGKEPPGARHGQRVLHARRHLRGCVRETVVRWWRVTRRSLSPRQAEAVARHSEGGGGLSLLHASTGSGGLPVPT